MKRRDFLKMAVGTVLTVSTVLALSKTEPFARKETIEFIYTEMAEMARDYIKGDDQDRQIIIEELNALILKMRGKDSRKAMTDFRDALLSHTEVKNA